MNTILRFVKIYKEAVKQTIKKANHFTDGPVVTLAGIDSHGRDVEVRLGEDEDEPGYIKYMQWRTNGPDGWGDWINDSKHLYSIIESLKDLKRVPVNHGEWPVKEASAHFERPADGSHYRNICPECGEIEQCRCNGPRTQTSMPCAKCSQL